MKLAYLGHCVHIGNDIDYKYTMDIDQSIFSELPNTYGISYIVAQGNERRVRASVLVQTDLGQTKDEIDRMFAAVVGMQRDLQGLPNKNVMLRTTKVNVDPKFVPTEQAIVDILQDLYLVNGQSGSA